MCQTVKNLFQYISHSLPLIHYRQWMPILLLARHCSVLHTQDYNGRKFSHTNIPANTITKTMTTGLVTNYIKENKTTQ